MKTITLCEIDTKYHADSVEWCPVVGYQNIFTCGTYQLNQGTDGTAAGQAGQRIGCIYLYQLCYQSGGDGVKCNLLQTLDTPGVLDMKWCQVLCEDYCLLAVASSDGSVYVYTLEESNETGSGMQLKLKYQSTRLGESNTSLALSLDWSCHCKFSSMEVPQITVSTSEGMVYILQLSEDKLEIIKQWKAHAFEAWITAFNYWNPVLVFSGGDDCHFKEWDLRASSSKPIFDYKEHIMGVTSIHKSALEEHLLATGSYEEKIRLWDVRNISSPLCDIDVGGGVWRLKWHPYNHLHILAACMHNGFHVLEQSEGGLKSIAAYSKHSSLAYGADWCWLRDDTTVDANESIVATCSFYDHKLNVWKTDVNSG